MDQSTISVHWLDNRTPLLPYLQEREGIKLSGLQTQWKNPCYGLVIGALGIPVF